MGTWPVKVEPELKPFYDKRFELKLINDCLFYGHRIPQSLQIDMLHELHSTHHGIIKTKKLAR